MTTSSFNLNDLPSSSKRLDMVARCIIASLWLSHRLREEAEIYIVLNGPPKPPVTLLFDANIKRVSPDERSIALWIKKALDRVASCRNKEWVELNNGIKVSKKSFQDVLKELLKETRNVYILHEKGRFIGNMEIKPNPVFILGDHEGIPKKEESFALRYGEKVSLGRKSYLASNCIAVINWLCDVKRIL